MSEEPAERSGISDEVDKLIGLAKGGDEAAMSSLFEMNRERLYRMVRLRMDDRLTSRVDVSDILQDAYVDLASQLANYAKDPKLPFFLWLRRLTRQRLVKTHRFHLHQQKRSLARETQLSAGRSDASSIYMATHLIGQFTSVAGRVLRREMQSRVQEILDGMPETDREIIALRHVEQLTYKEIAVVTDISEAAATKRYARSIRKLQQELQKIPGFPRLMASDPCRILPNSSMNDQRLDPNQSADDRSERLDEIVVEYLSRVEQGEPSSIIDEYCAKHLDFANDLRNIVRTIDLASESAHSTASADLEEISKRAPRELPKRIGEYDVLRELGHGGMGVVYEADHATLGRKVALKVLFPGHAQNDKSIERFHREARAIARLHHTNIVPLFEFGEANGQLFLAMQFISGKSLDLVVNDLLNLDETEQQPEQFIPSRSATRQSFYHRVAEIGVEAGFALQHAHDGGIIHRDVKPSNLLIDDDGRVWLSDFGLSKADDETMTRTGEIVGTVRYMSPERFKGVCDERSDVYSLALTIYELLTLSRAFDRSDHLQMIDQILNESPPPPRSVRRDIPRDLETVILKAIDKSPQNRYQTAAAFADDLLRFIRDEPIRARRTSLVEQTRRWVRRNRRLAIALATTACCLLVIAVGTVAFSLRESSLRQLAEEKVEEALASNIAANRARDLADLREQSRRRSQYSAEMNLASQRIGKAASAEQVAAITERWSTPENKLFRGWEWYYLRSSVLDSAINSSCPTLREASWSPDDTKVVAATTEGTEGLIVDAYNGEVAGKLVGHEAKLGAVAWNPKRNLIATGANDKTLRIWDAGTLQCLQTLRVEHNVAGTVWSHDGSQLAFVTVDGVKNGSTTLHVITVPPSIFQRPFEWMQQFTRFPTIQDFTGGKALQWSPDGTQVAATMSRGPWGREKKVAIWNTKTHEIDRQPFPAACIQWRPEGNGVLQYATDTPYGEIQMRAGDTGEIIWHSPGHTAQISSLHFSPNGQQLLSAGYDNTVRIWDVLRGDQLRICQEHAGGVLAVRWNHAGDRIVSSCFGNRLLFWNRKSQFQKNIANSPKLKYPFSSTVQLSWHPDSRQIATSASIEHVLRVHDTETGHSSSLSLPVTYIWRCSWNPQGTKAAYCGDAIGFAIPIVDQLPSDLCWSNARDHNVGAFDLDWGSNGSKLAVATGTRTDRGKPYYSVRLYDPTGSVIKDMLVGDEKWMAISWNPTQDNLIAIASSKGDIQFLDINREMVVSELKGHDRAVTCLDWNHDGTLLASTSNDGTIRIWSIKDGLMRTLHGHNNYIAQVSWHPDGRRLASAGNDGVTVWDSDTGVEMLTLDDHRSAPQSVEWSPDGRKLASGDMTGRVIVWDATLGYESVVGDNNAANKFGRYPAE